MMHRKFRFAGALLIMTICLASQPRFAGADSGAESLSRLFTDPETRARMDATRNGDPVSAGSEPEQAAQKVRVDGVVIRENGENVVWINGESSLKSNNKAGAHARPRQIDSENYRVPVRIDDKTVRLKPGQAWSGESGKVADDY